ncbi:hypothetical protein [Geminocystis sp.]|uniref:hypothetical protein n=1 Tax=Geminocystis sp. TaxID=2664100 RepID=UPI0035942D6C
MNESLNHIRQTIILIKYYSFDLGSYNIRELIVKWTKIYPHNWLPLGITEAIYQGRLKAVSVEQILNLWLKKGGINQSFNYEFCRLIKPETNFFLEEDKELKDIFSQECQNQESKNILPINDEEISRDNIGIISPEFSLDNFQPLNDYSQCFQKLKSFTIDKKLDKL